MTIEARTAIYGASRVESRRDSNSSNGYQDCNTSDDDGYFTSAVSVQHKVISENSFDRNSFIEHQKTPDSPKTGRVVPSRH